MRVPKAALNQRRRMPEILTGKLRMSGITETSDTSLSEVLKGLHSSTSIAWPIFLVNHVTLHAEVFCVARDAIAHAQLEAQLFESPRSPE